MSYIRNDVPCKMFNLHDKTIKLSSKKVIDGDILEWELKFSYSWTGAETTIREFGEVSIKAIRLYKVITAIFHKFVTCINPVFWG